MRAGRRGYEACESLAAEARALVAERPCESGRPSCAESLTCVSFSERSQRAPLPRVRRMRRLRTTAEPTPVMILDEAAIAEGVAYLDRRGILTPG